MNEYKYFYRNEPIKAEPNFGSYFTTKNLYFYVRLHEEGSMSRIIDITEKYDQKLPYLFGLVSDCYSNENINFLIKYNLAEPTGEKMEIDGKTCWIFKFNEDMLKSINPRMFDIYRKNFN